MISQHGTWDTNAQSRALSDQHTILSPAAPAARAESAPHGALAQLKGKVVAFIDNTKPNFNLLADDMAALLVERYGAARIVRHCKRSPSDGASTEMLQDIAESCDLVIAGSGD
jgi:hypothetical protein